MRRGPGLCAGLEQPGNFAIGDGDGGPADPGWAGDGAGHQAAETAGAGEITSCHGELLIGGLFAKHGAESGSVGRGRGPEADFHRRIRPGWPPGIEDGT